MRQIGLKNFVCLRQLTLLACCLFAVISQAAAQAVSVSVDATANQHPISPQIYGVAYYDHSNPGVLSDLNVSLNRWGGNSNTRYNWQTNAINTAADYYYESIGSGTQSQDADQFINDAKGHGAEPMMSIPMIDWIAKSGPGHPYLCSYPTSTFPNQQSVDQYQTNCGNGKNPDGSLIASPLADPSVANVQNSVTTQKAWVQYLVNTFKSSTQGGVKYYILDNEVSIWFGTHRDVHPNGPSMDEIFQKMRDTAIAIKAVDSNALVSGPEEYGWDGYFFSGKDQQLIDGGDYSEPDKAAHGGADYVPWLLDQLHSYDTTNHQRLLDIFTLHYYPSGDLSGHYEDTDDDTATTQQLRNVSTRSLWDPNYVDQSWIHQTGINGGKVQLIPLMKQWVSLHYPGTKIGITEYNWGDESKMNGATAQADVMGIFGREGLDVGTRWTTPDPSTPTYNAMKMYRNYDGSKSTFGDTSVKATVPNPDHLAAFSALRSSDGALTVMLINKDTGTSPQVNLSLAHFANTGVAHAWQLTSANTITQLSDIHFVSNTVNITLPVQSITLLVLPAAPAADFSVSVSNAVQTVVAKQTATFNGTLTAINGYSNSVSVTCGSSAPATCNPTTVTPTAGGAAFSVTASNPSGGDFNFNLVATGSDALAVTHTQAVTLHVSDFTISVPTLVQTVLAGSTATFSGTLTSQSGYSSSVTISCGSGAPATCNPTTVTPTAGGAAFSITASNPTGGDFTFNLVATGSDSQTTTHQQQVTLHVSDFSISVSNPVLTVLPGATATFNGTLTSQNGYNSSVTVSCGAGAPPTCGATPVIPTAGGAAFSINASSNTTATYTFNLVATGSDANALVRNQQVTLNVVNVTADLAATLTRSPATRYVAVGTPLTYTSTVTNNGPTTTVATLTFTFPRKVRITMMDAACTGSGPVVCTSSSLATSAQATFHVTILAPMTHDLMATATVSSTTTADPTPGNNTATNPVRIYLRPFRRSEVMGAP